MTMQYVNLGNCGLRVSRLCLGVMSYGSPDAKKWILAEEESRPFFRLALERGINFFDTADMYSDGRSEEILGRAIRTLARREDVVIATKVYFPTGTGPNDAGLSRKHILDAIDGSLRRLGTDYVDLYQIHRWDDHTPIEETLATLDGLVRSGKVRYLGASSMFAWQLMKALALSDARGWERFVSMQNHYNLVYREEEREMLPLCISEGLAVLPWSPLARGLLARGGRSDSVRATSDAFARELYTHPGDLEVAEQVARVAQEKNLEPAQVALAWLLHQPAVTAPIIGATKLYQLEQALGAIDVVLSAEECLALERLYQPHRVLGIS